MIFSLIFVIYHKSCEYHSIKNVNDKAFVLIMLEPCRYSSTEPVEPVPLAYRDSTIKHQEIFEVGLYNKTVTGSLWCHFMYINIFLALNTQVMKKLDRLD